MPITNVPDEHDAGFDLARYAAIMEPHEYDAMKDALADAVGALAGPAEIQELVSSRGWPEDAARQAIQDLVLDGRVEVGPGGLNALDPDAQYFEAARRTAAVRRKRAYEELPGIPVAVDPDTGEPFREGDSVELKGWLGTVRAVHPSNVVEVEWLSAPVPAGDTTFLARPREYFQGNTTEPYLRKAGGLAEDDPGEAPLGPTTRPGPSTGPPAAMFRELESRGTAPTLDNVARWIQGRYFSSPEDARETARRWVETGLIEAADGGLYREAAAKRAGEGDELERMGGAAFRAGKPRAPFQDEDSRPLLERVDPGTAPEAARAWLRGWDAASLEGTGDIAPVARRRIGRRSIAQDYMEVARTIWEQIPQDFKMNRGARTPVGTPEGLMFAVRLTPGKTHKFVVKYDYGSDLYDVELWDVTGTAMDRLDSSGGVYADMLADAMERMARPYSE